MRSIKGKQADIQPKKSNVAAPKKKPAGTAKPLALKPRVSEKAYAQSESFNVYIFDVDQGINKDDISQAVSAQYGVSVIKVRLSKAPGKSVRTYRQKGRRSVSGRRSNIRKAYVTLKEGEKLPIFAAVEESKAPQEAK